MNHLSDSYTGTVILFLDQHDFVRSLPILLLARAVGDVVETTLTTINHF